MFKGNKKAQEENGVRLIVMLVIGVAVLVTIAFNLGVTQQQINEDITDINVSNTQFGQVIQLANDRIVDGSVQIFNTSCVSAGCRSSRNGTLTESNEFSVDLRNGRVTFLNRTGDWNITYDSKPAAYADSSLTRTILSFIAVFAGLAVLFFVGRGILNK